MRRVIGGFPVIAAAMAMSHATPDAAPICPHCRTPVGASLDEQHMHATGRCVDPAPSEPNRARSFLDSQYENIQRGREIKRREQDDRRRAHEARRAADHAAAAKRIENAIAKRARKATQRQRDGL